MKKNIRTYLGLTAFLLLTSFSQANIAWEENFNDPAIDQKGATGSTIDMTGVTKWSINVNNTNLDSTDYFRVQNQLFEGRDLDGEAVWESEEVNIAGLEDVEFQLTASEVGDLEGAGNGANTDYMNIYYSVNGGAFQLIPDWNNYGDSSHTLIDDWNSTTVSKSIGDGNNTLKIRVVMKNSANTEYLRIDDVKITTTTTLPVTISYVHPVNTGGELDLDFSTATETNNIGFNIYAIKGKGKHKKWIKLNDELIDGAMNSLVPLDYHTTLMIPDTMKLKKIGIAGVDVNGVEDRHGPFKVGKESGSKASIVPIKWHKVRKAYKADKKARKAAKKAKRQSKRAAKKATKGLFKDEIVNLQVKENAVYRITHNDLLANDINLKGFNAKRIAISFKGKGVARHIEGLNKKGKWTKKSYIEFKGQKPKGQDALYLSANNYRLSLNKKLVVDSDGIKPVTAKELVFENNKIYGWTSPGDDPFFDKLFYTRAVDQTAQVTRTFELSEVPQGDVKVTAYVGAYSNTKHHLQLSLNGSQVAEVSADAGWKDMPITVTINGSAVQEGTNTITVNTVGESDTFDVYTYDKVVIAYDNGEAQESKTLMLSLSDKIKKKFIKPKRGTNYVIVSHPMFMTESLNNYISQKESEGWNIHLVNVEDIYNAYGYGMATPEAIKSYLKVAKRRGVTHVQLVGSASYDYLDTLGLGSVSFIGSAYVMTGSMTRYTPSDSYLVADETGIPQMAIGRWPVRTTEGLEAVISKSLSWKDSGQLQAHSALFIADKNEEVNFGKQQDALSEQFKATGLWSDITKVYFDAYTENNNGDEAVALEAARNDIQQALNNGASITSFSGHSSLSTWSFKGMLKASDIAAINNTDRTTIALPLACYATYADSPSINTLAHQFLAAGENGAVAVYGAASLSSFKDNSKSAEKVIEYLLKGETIGEAVRKTKVDLGTRYIDVIRNSNLLGDVTLSID